MVCVSFLQGESCAEFPRACWFPLVGKGSEAVVLSADDRVCVCALLAAWMRSPAQGVAGPWVSRSRGFLCVSSHYLILPRVSSLVG